MRNIKENLEISQLLLLYLKGELLESDKEKVETLLIEDHDINTLFKNIQKKEYLETQLKRHASLNLEDKWLVQKRKIQQEKRRNQFLYFSRIAAAILIPAFISVYFLFMQEKPFNDTKLEFVANVIPKSSKVQLINEEGQIFELEKNMGKQITDELVDINIKGRSLVYNESETTVAIQAKEDIHTLIVPQGSEYTLELSDGSVIHVYAQSKIKYPKQFIGANRVVQLMEGEAYFEIAPDAEHPFHVKTEKGLVEVLGTSFNIRAYNDEVENTTTLIEGSVSLRSVNDLESVVMLKPGMQGVIDDAAKKISVEEVDVYPIIAWKEGFYIFNASLEDIFHQLSRQYDFEVEYQSELIKKMKFRGNVDRKAGVIEILNLLEKTESVNFEYRGKTIRVKEIKK